MKMFRHLIRRTQMQCCHGSIEFQRPQHVWLAKVRSDSVAQMLIINKWKNLLKMRLKWHEKPDVSRLLLFIQWQIVCARVISLLVHLQKISSHLFHYV